MLTITPEVARVTMRRLADGDHHARGRELTGGVTTSPEAQSMYDV